MSEQGDVAVEDRDEVDAPTDRALVHHASRSIAERARTAYDPGQVDLIRATVAKDCNDAELALFLETCIRHDLDPFIKEIWAYKKSGRVVIQASRDGLLGIANRHTPEGKYHVHGPGMFLGCPSDVVYEHDLFDKWEEEREDETIRVRIEHRYRDESGKPTHGGADASKRGKIVGAWARVRRHGHDDTFFFAYANEYLKTSSEGPVWGSHPHAMMQKCAESVVLRKAFSIAGVVGEDETHRERTSLTQTTGDSRAEIAWPEDPEQAEKLKTLFKELGWRRARVRLTVNAVGMEGGDADFPALIARLNSEIDQRAAEAEETAGDEDAVQDAVVVDEPPPPTDADAPADLDQ
jgi:hypothetical protein